MIGMHVAMFSATVASHTDIVAQRPHWPLPPPPPAICGHKLIDCTYVTYVGRLKDLLRPCFGFVFRCGRRAGQRVRWLPTSPTVHPFYYCKLIGCRPTRLLPPIVYLFLPSDFVAAWCMYTVSQKKLVVTCNSSDSRINNINSVLMLGPTTDGKYRPIAHPVFQPQKLLALLKKL